MSSSTHPYNEEEGDRRFVPAMNIYELYPEYSEYRIEPDKNMHDEDRYFKFIPSILVGENNGTDN